MTKRSSPAERYRTLGSMNMTGFGSRMALSSRPLACIGERGITICGLGSSRAEKHGGRGKNAL